MNTPQKYKHVLTFYLRVLLNGIADELLFKVNESEQDRLWDILENEKNHKKFFWFKTTDGYDVLLSIQDIQIVNFLWEHEFELEDQIWQTAVKNIIDEDEDDDDDDDMGTPPIKMFFRNRTKPFETYTVSDGTYSILTALCDLDDLDQSENRFIPFSDEDDETVTFNSNQLVLLIVPSKEIPTWDELDLNQPNEE